MKNATFVVCGMGYVQFAVEVEATSEEEAAAIFQQCADTLVHTSHNTYFTDLDVREIAEIDENLVD